ncbi:MAG: RsmG family class I SAM-dependent methyltransferase [Ilumatobacteraceae bacterium]
MAALGDLRSDGGVVRIIDLGSGGGVPGLVIAHDLPEAQVVLLDRRSKRTDFLERMVRRLGWTDRVRVICGEAERAVDDQAHAFDAAVARGFGPPSFTLRIGAGLVRSGGRIVISEPPDGDRWDPTLLAKIGVRRLESPGHSPDVAARVVCFGTLD